MQKTETQKHVNFANCCKRPKLLGKKKSTLRPIQRSNPYIWFFKSYFKISVIIKWHTYTVSTQYGYFILSWPTLLAQRHHLCLSCRSCRKNSKSKSANYNATSCLTTHIIIDNLLQFNNLKNFTFLFCGFMTNQSTCLPISIFFDYPTSDTNCSALAGGWVVRCWCRRNQPPTVTSNTTSDIGKIYHG